MPVLGMQIGQLIGSGGSPVDMAGNICNGCIVSLVVVKSTWTWYEDSLVHL